MLFQKDFFLVPETHYVYSIFSTAKLKRDPV